MLQRIPLPRVGLSVPQLGLSVPHVGLVNFGGSGSLCKRREDLLHRNGPEYVGEPYVGILGGELALEPVAKWTGYSAPDSDEVELPGIEAVAGLLGLGRSLGVDASVQERSDDAPVDFGRSADHQRSRRSDGETVFRHCGGRPFQALRGRRVAKRCCRD
jgi:hypothetical protein